MQITRVAIHRFEIPLEEPFVTALRPIPALERVLVEVETDVGLTGVGEGAPAYEVTGETQGSTAAVLADVLAPAVLGEDPLAVERLVRRMRALVDGAPSAHAALEIAFQDLRGKAAEQPLYRLLGGNAEEPTLTVPKVLSIKPPDEMAADAAAAVDEGYDQLKIKLGRDPETDIERVTAIAAAVPDETSLKADANQGWGDAKTAVEALAGMAHHLDVIEQPVAKENVSDLAFLRDRLDVPVMPDESVETATDALDLIKRGAGDVFNIKLMKTGGIAEAVRLNAVAEADDRPTQLGSMVEGHVGTAAGIHFASAFENVIWNEMVGPFMTTEGITDLRADVPRIETSGPGLGVRVDRTKLRSLRSDVTEIEP
ncbi:mandelate racemase/muconate lactonizing enzyme family protein [Haladaptatus salinisoli]|uniref:mandelate racemase/muconate lactonizing enzyme family protein n=1 Tax=Haladaptatus salinisoli TaxID=2884876 RepID=UPI001D0B3EB4|nr:dipeptide epimerase [Haladaptatus salinisoli]